VSIEYLELIDYLAVAVEVTGLSVETVARVTDLSLADSALHAPAAGFGETGGA
jgi:death on curing protein